MAKAYRLKLLNAANARKVLDAIEADLADGKHAADVKPGSLNEQVLLTEITEARALLGGVGPGNGGASGLGGLLGVPRRLLRGRKRKKAEES